MLKLCKEMHKHEKAKVLFPLNNHVKKLRHSEKFKVKFVANERYKKSSIPYMQNLLNQDEAKKNEMKRFIGL